MTTDRTDQLIRAALAAEAERRPDPRVVLAGLERRRARPGRNRTPLLVVAAAAVVVVAVAAVLVPRMFSRGEPVVGTTPAAAQTVLLVGLDDNDWADSIVLGRFGGDGTAALASIPRDSWVDVPGAGQNKLSQVYVTAKQAALHQGKDDQSAGEAGVRALIDTVQQLTGTHVDHYGLVAMAGFGELARVLQGVPVCLRAAAHDPRTGASFPAGQQTLTEATALDFLRQRMNLPNGDLDRIARLQAFLRSATEKLVTGGTLKDRDAVAALIGAAQRTVRVDPGWNLFDFAALVSDVRPDGLRIGTVPTAEADSPRMGTISVVPEQVRTFVANLPATGPVTPGSCVD